MIGLESSNVCDEMQIIDGVVIQPSQGCYTEDEVKTEEMEWTAIIVSFITRFLAQISIGNIDSNCRE